MFADVQPADPAAKQKAERNAANEVAVSAFLEQKIKFINISEVVMEIVERHQKREVLSLEEIFDEDRDTRLLTQNLLKERY